MEDGLLCVNLFSRRKSFGQSVARLMDAFDDHAIAFPSCDSGNAIALAANISAPAVPPAPTFDELKEAAQRLKKTTGLNLLPTLARLAQAHHLAGGILQI